MIKLILGNSYSQVTGVTLDQLKKLRAVCSYKPDPKAAYFSGSHNAVRHLMDKKGMFPSGLLSYVETILKGIPFYLEDRRTRPQPQGKPLTLSLPHTPYELQTKAVEACMRVDRGTVSACTGFGKSVMIAMLIARLQLRCLVIVPNLGLKTQLKESLKEWFGDTKGMITVENIDSPKLSKLTDFDVLIIDEAHHSAAKTYRALNKKAWGKIYYRFNFTATPFRSRDEENILMETITSKVIYEITYKDALKVGAVVPVEAFYFELPKVTTDAYTWKEVYSELIVKNLRRNTLIQELLLSLHRGGRPTLCLVKEIAHGETLTYGGAFVFANGQDEESGAMIQRFNDRKANVLIGTTGVLGEGVDSKPCEYVIIAGLGKSKPQFMQCVGRALRRYPGKETAKVIIFLDKTHKWTKSHFDTQRKILLEEYGAAVVRLEL